MKMVTKKVFELNFIQPIENFLLLQFYSFSNHFLRIYYLHSKVPVRLLIKLAILYLWTESHL